MYGEKEGKKKLSRKTRGLRGGRGGGKSQGETPAQYIRTQPKRPAAELSGF